MIPRQLFSCLVRFVFMLTLLHLPATHDSRVLAASSSSSSEVFTFGGVIKEARELAQKPFKAPKGDVPERLMKVSYDQWRDIRFKPEQAFWRQEKLPFTLQFFHPGLYYDRVVAFHVIDSKGIVRPIAFSRDYFDYKSPAVRALVPDDLGFAGFRIHYPINTSDYHDEVAVFVGASYFRAVGKGMNYGLSARGLAIDTVLPSGEEFPFFRKFWIHQPSVDAKEISFYALLDSPSVAGAYHFIIRPGRETVIDVDMTLFLRKPVAKLGIAPLTSMYHHGENTVDRILDDFRPEIHDSDGLMIATGTGEWIWRPLVNPRTLQVNSFQVTNPAGFGLYQRDMEFDHYQDLESNYENRPSLWIRPKGEWGEGRIELIQIPTDKEIFDNMVAFWVPAKPPELGEPLSLAYQMSWLYASNSPRPPAGRVIATRIGVNKMENAKYKDAKMFVIDFAGGRLDSLSADQPVEGIVTVSGSARIVEQLAYRNRFTKGWRLVFQVLLDKEARGDKGSVRVNPPLELRAFLKRGEDVLTETWTYTYQP